jgi:hypothetical protein
MTGSPAYLASKRIMIVKWVVPEAPVVPEGFLILKDADGLIVKDADGLIILVRE